MPNANLMRPWWQCPIAELLAQPWAMPDHDFAPRAIIFPAGNS